MATAVAMMIEVINNTGLEMSFEAGVNVEKENYHQDRRHHRSLFWRLGVPRSVPINRHAVSLQSTNALLFL